MTFSQQRRTIKLRASLVSKYFILYENLFKNSQEQKINDLHTRCDVDNKQRIFILKKNEAQLWACDSRSYYSVNKNVSKPTGAVVRANQNQVQSRAFINYWRTIKPVVSSLGLWSAETKKKSNT